MFITLAAIATVSVVNPLAIVVFASPYPSSSQFGPFALGIAAAFKLQCSCHSYALPLLLTQNNHHPFSPPAVQGSITASLKL